jgi:hypothetical protein
MVVVVFIAMFVGVGMMVSVFDAVNDRTAPQEQEGFEECVRDAERRWATRSAALARVALVASGLPS